ncbi:MAG: hypothetical protein CL450_05945 [Acidimicrobiaceae bacterium]|nr:hypothetical protein [Acidimicrobiaceae bacterium]
MSDVSTSKIAMGCIALAGMVAVVVAMGCDNSSTASQERPRGKPTRLLRLPAPPETTDSCRKHDGKSPLIIPMRADDNGIFIVNIGVEDDDGNTQWIKAAVDTGSEAMLVAGDECDGCEEGIHMGTVKNDGVLLQRGTIRYGSQQDTVAWRSKIIRIPAWLHTCDPLDHDGAHTDITQCIVGEVPVAVVESRTGTSDYNILGLGSQSARGPPATLNALFPQPPRAFQIQVHSDTEARLIIHKPDGAAGCRAPKYKFAVKDKNLGHAHHYLVAGKDATLFKTGAIGGSNPGTPISDKTYDVLFDTGANAISLPAEIYDAIHNTNHVKGVLALTFTTMDQNDQVTLRLDYDRRDKFNAQVLKGHSQDMLIIGITFLKNHSLGFEDDGQTRVMTLDYL